MGGMRRLLIFSVVAILPLGGCGDEEELSDNSVFIGCIKRLACGVLDYPRVSNCVDNYATAFNYGSGEAEGARLKCAANAASCDKVRACYGEGSTCDTSYKASCVGGKAMYCDTLAGKTYTHDCGALGMGCHVDSTSGVSFNAWCTGGKSTPDLPTSPSCGGDLCTDPGEACDGNTNDTCSGEKVKSCVGGKWVLFDCKHLGLGACFTSAGFSSCGMFP